MSGNTSSDLYSNSGVDRLTVKSITEADFNAMSTQWRACLSRSEAHPLFMGWPWLFSWWETWGRTLGLDLVLLGVYDEQNELVGIGPFCRGELVTPLGFRVRRLYLMGNAWRIAPTVRTEYCGLIVNRDRAEQVWNVLIGAVSELHWDECVIGDMLQTESHRMMEEFDQSVLQLSKVVRMKDEGVLLNVRGSFREWLNSLGPNTRLKVYNRRDYLDKRGTLEFSPWRHDKFEDFIAVLNHFHDLRWGKPAFDDDAVLFHTRFKSRIIDCGGQVKCSQMKFDGERISVLYDVIVGDKRFNLQSGYVEDFDRRVSLGAMHLGFAIEDSFNDPDISHYDLLAGGGKHCYYKSHFHGEKVEFQTVQFVRRPMLKGLYYLQKRVPRRLAGYINRWFRL
jgi:hypothetical protein